MSDKNNSSGGTNQPQLDHLELWLNYENKMDELRNRFLTIASILFAVQVGVFTLMLDKVLLSDGEPYLTKVAGWLLVALSVVIAIFLIIIYSHYKLHIKRNFYRSCYIVEHPPEANLTIKDLKKKLCAYLGNPPKAKPPSSPWWVMALSFVLLLFIWFMFGLGWKYNLPFA